MPGELGWTQKSILTALDRLPEERWVTCAETDELIYGQYDADAYHRTYNRHPLRRLEARGLVESAPTGYGFGRAKVVWRITPFGRRLVLGLRAKRGNVDDAGYG